MDGLQTPTTPKISSETPIPEIVRLLPESGCPDITSQIDIPRCSEWNINGGGQGDIYRGKLVDGRCVAVKTARGDQSLDLLSQTFVEFLTSDLPFPELDDDIKVLFAVMYKNAVPDRPERLQARSLRHERWWLFLNQCWNRQPDVRPKAGDLDALDRDLAAHRAQQLLEQLPHMLCYARTKQGLPK
ncbi:hypothetical protein FRC08_018976, partial [Ceratobasidium sp. 394]